MSNLWDSYILQARESNRALVRKRLSEAGRLGSWRRWHRERAITNLLPMVDRVAKNVRWMFAPHLEFRDLTQAGCQGLVSASNTYEPAKSGTSFESYAYFRTRGAIIDSQKRRPYREEQNLSIDKPIPGGKTTDSRYRTLGDSAADRKPLPDADAQAEEIHRLLWEAIADLPQPGRRVIECQMEGLSLTATASLVGLSLTRTRAALAEARGLVGAAVRGE
jgi:RNA polymerase sigma factor (sigma-70 family)